MLSEIRELIMKNIIEFIFFPILVPYRRLKRKVISFLSVKTGFMTKLGDKTYLVFLRIEWYPRSLKGKKAVLCMVADPKDNSSHRPGQWFEIKPKFIMAVINEDELV